MEDHGIAFGEPHSNQQWTDLELALWAFGDGGAQNGIFQAKLFI
jgi:hypothetical protein